MQNTQWRDDVKVMLQTVEASDCRFRWAFQNILGFEEGVLLYVLQKEPSLDHNNPVLKPRPWIVLTHGGLKSSFTIIKRTEGTRCLTVGEQPDWGKALVQWPAHVFIYSVPIQEDVLQSDRHGLLRPLFLASTQHKVRSVTGMCQWFLAGWVSVIQHVNRTSNTSVQK